MSLRTKNSIYQTLYSKYSQYIDNPKYVYKSCQKDYIVILKLLDDSRTNMKRISISDAKNA